jgi:hypothetical protein
LKSFELTAVNSSEGSFELVDELFKGLFLDETSTIGFGELFVAAPEMYASFYNMVVNEYFSISGLHPVLKLRVRVCLPFDSYGGLKNQLLKPAAADIYWARVKRSRKRAQAKAIERKKNRRNRP